MKNYLKSLFTKVKNVYNYYKALNYNAPKSKYKFINFLCLMKYIIFEEVSIFLKFKPRIMNEENSKRLTAEAQKYLGREILYENDINCIFHSIRGFKFGGDKAVDLWAILKEVSDPSKQHFLSLQAAVDYFKNN